jgi:hypothetical protein
VAGPWCTIWISGYSLLAPIPGVGWGRPLLILESILFQLLQLGLRFWSRGGGLVGVDFCSGPVFPFFPLCSWWGPARPGLWVVPCWAGPVCRGR